MADDLIPPAGAGEGPAPRGGGRPGPDYRDIQNPTPMLEPWRLQDNGAAARAEALANAFKSFENISAGVGTKLAAKAGTTAGAAAGAAGNGAPISGLASITPYAQSYNAAVHSTYVTQSQLALEQQLTDIEKQNLGNPDAFQQQATAAVQGALKPMDPTYQPEMSLWAQNRVQAGVNRQTQQKSEDVRNQALATYQSATPDLITSALHTAAALPTDQGDQVIAKLVSDDQDRLNALVASRTITPEQAVTLHQKMVDNAHQQMTGQRIDLSLQPVLATMRTNVEAADKLIVQADPNLTPEENAARLHGYEQDRAAYVQSQTRARADELNQVHQALAGGSYGPQLEGTIHGLYKSGALSEEAYFSATAESVRNQRAAIDRDAGLKLVDDAMHGGPRLDPKDPATKDAVDEYFKEHVSQSGGVGSDQFAIGASEVVRQTGVVPKSVQSQIRVGLLSGDPTQTARAAALAAKISGVNPEADLYNGTPRLAALAGLVNDNLAAGLPPAKAVEMARAAVDIPEGQRKIRDQHYAVDAKTSNGNQAALASALNSQDGGIFTHAPKAPVAMQAAYEGLTHQFYDQVGDIAKARQLAGEQLRKTWGVSKVNGDPQYMQYPIPDNIVSTVRQDIADSVKDAGYTGDPSQIHLTPNAQTTASGGRVWSLTHVTPNGDTDVLLDKNNRPLVYHVPTPEDFAKQQRAIADQKLDQARHQRDIDRANSAEENRLEESLSNYYLDPANRGKLGYR